MSEVELSAEKLVRFLFIHATDSTDITNERITIECNYCLSEQTIFFEGEDDNSPDSTWLADAAVHVSENHKDKYEDM